MGYYDERRGGENEQGCHSTALESIICGELSSNAYLRSAIIRSA